MQIRLTAFFFSLIPPPPRFTLFPSTTLFRSPSGRIDRGKPRLALGTGVHLGDIKPIGRLHPLRIDFRPADNRDLDYRRGDRKSTRLNSSHVSISYAVFCLKKKTKHYTVLQTT